MKQYKHITYEERYVIQKMLYAKKTKQDISKFMERHLSTIDREIKRNKTRAYNAFEAHALYLQRRDHKPKKIESNIDLFLFILEKLFDYWSPEQISNELKNDYPHDITMRISPETIYLWLYEQKRNGILLYKFLRQNHKKRQKRQNDTKRRCIIEEKKSIHERAEVANQKTEIGHWEGDLIESKGKDCYMLNLIEKATLFSVSAKMNDKKSETCIKAFMEAFWNIPNKYIKTITVDNGSEFKGFKVIEELLECNIYFCDPYSAWQKGTIENHNGLLRQFLPKKKSFKKITEKEIIHLQNRLNKRPRKTINFVTPYEAFWGDSFALQT